MKYLACDLETSGISVEKDEPVEIALADFDNPSDYNIRSYFIATEVRMSPKAAEVHGIQRKDYINGLKPEIFCKSFKKLLVEKEIETLIFYNGFKFDIPMLNNMMKRYNVDFDLFSLKIEDPGLWYVAENIFKIKRPTTNEEYSKVAAMRTPYGSKWSLSHVCAEMGIPFDVKHRAKEDTEVTIKVWKRMRANAL